MSRPNIIQICLELDDMNALKRHAQRVNLKPGTLGRLLLTEVIRSKRQLQPTKEAKR